MRVTSPPGLNELELAQPIMRGGTSAISAPKAVTNLSLVKTSMKDVDNGVFSLDSTGKIAGSKFPSANGTNKVNVSGSLLVFVNTTVTFQITDFDSFKAYTLSVSAGSVSRSNDTITYTATGVAQMVNMTINGRVIQLNVSLPAPAQPTITTPVNGAVNQSTSSLSATASAFVAQGDSSTHLASDWQLASDAGFSSIIAQSLADTTNKTSWSPAVTLSVNTTYYLRVRYKGSNGNYGAYSATSSYTTKTIAEATVETAILTSDFGTTAVGFGYGISLSEDGLRLATISGRNANSFGTTSYNMRYYVFHKAAGVWTKVFTLDNQADAPSGLTGSSNYLWFNQAKMSPDGQRLFLLEPDNGAGKTLTANEMFMDGRVRIYSWNGTTYNLETTLTNSVKGLYGAHLAVNQAATKMVVTQPFFGDTQAPTMLFYTRSGSTWTLQNTYGTRRTINANGWTSIAMSKDGTRLVVTYYNPFATNANTNLVWASVYTVGTTALTFEQDISIAIPAGGSGQAPGRSCAINNDGSVIAIGSGDSSHDANSLGTNTGSVYIYTRSVTTWTQDTRLINNDVTVTENFGQVVCLNDAGDKIMVAAPNNNYGGTTGRGCYYLFTKSGGIWTRTTSVSSSGGIASSQFSADMGANNNLTALAARGLIANGSIVVNVFN